jgi:transglutaminase-like putative cysteine protease
MKAVWTVLTVTMPSLAGAQSSYRIGSPSPWVHPLAVDGAAPLRPGRVTAGFEYLLIDQQQAVLPTGIEQFRHVAYRPLDQEAVQDNSQIELTFDPSYEGLTLHGVTVTRNGRSLNQLQPKRISVVRRERQMDYQIFDGRLSLVLLLEDVKPGDIVEYSYTRRGANPVFASHFMEDVVLQQTVPVRRLQFRLLWPQDRPLSVRRYATSLEPSVTVSGPFREYRWAVQDVPAKLLDDDLPQWYDALPEIELSDFTSWGEVADWGAGLFVSSGPRPQALTAPLARIRASGNSPQAQVLAALRFVQDEVRYFGVEIGVNSHRPYSPATVLQRRYGDCKDKALLLVTMLRELGVTARPALVSTQYGEHIREREPSAAAFDHAIVEAEVDGRVYWLDPTELPQGGDLNSVGARFGAALVLGADVDSLSTMLTAAEPEPTKDITVTFELASVDSPATMRVETRYRGRTADHARSTIRQTSIEELRREYTSFYAAAYPGIRSDTAPVIDDDEGRNVLRTTEWYTIPGFWHQAADHQGYIGTLDPLELDREVPSPTTSERTMPLGITHPVHVRYAIDAHLDAGWSIVSRGDTVVTPGFRFTREVAAHDGVLSLRYEYASLADHIPPGAVGPHMEQAAKARRLLTFSITPPQTGAAEEPQGMNWPIIFAALVTALVAVYAALRVARAPPPAWPHRPSGAGDDPVGLGGWLVLVGIGVCLSPVMLLYGLLKDTGTYGLSTWAQLTTPGTPHYHSLYAPVLLLELIGPIILVVFACLQAWLFFQRRRWFPAVFVALAVARVSYDWLDAILANGIPAVNERGVAWAVHVRNLFVLSIWIAYMFRSRRVQNTFVR